MSISGNIAEIRKKIAAAAIKSGRKPEEIIFLAATKDVPHELIREAVSAGITDIGENRVQEAAGKYDQLKDLQVKWHMIGHLQTNKVKAALGIFNCIQSVDSERLADEISKRADKTIEVFIEVNTSGEASKYGIDPSRAVDLAKYISGLINIKLTGLMTVGPLEGGEEKMRMSFKMLKNIQEQIKELNLSGVELKYLSMGMSQDYEVAIEEGSNLVRMGMAVFHIEHKRPAT